MPAGLELAFFRTHTGAEIDLLIHDGHRVHLAVEVKHAAVPKLRRGFHSARSDLGQPPAIVVSPTEAAYPLAEDIEVVNLRDAMVIVRDLRR